MEGPARRVVLLLGILSICVLLAYVPILRATASTAAVSRAVPGDALLERARPDGSSIHRPPPQREPGKTVATLLMHVEDAEDDAVRKRYAARLHELGVTKVVAVTSPPFGRRGKCAEYVPRRAAIGASKSMDAHGATSVVADQASNFHGLNHVSMYAAMKRAAGTRGCVAVDCGVNEGAITTWLASSGCRVFAYEALRSNWRRVYGSLQSRPELAQRVRFFWAAVSDSCGTRLEISENNGGADDLSGQRNGQINAGGRADNSAVYTRRIDDDVDEDVLLIKIDIEGFEPAGLAGALGLLRRRNVPFIHAEFSPNNVHSPVGASGWLYMMVALDYEIYLADCQGANTQLFRNTELTCEDVGEAELVDKVVRGEELRNKRLLLNEIEPFIQGLKGGSGGHQVNLLLFKREALEKYRPSS